MIEVSYSSALIFKKVTIRMSYPWVRCLTSFDMTDYQGVNWLSGFLTTFEIAAESGIVYGFILPKTILGDDAISNVVRNPDNQLTP